MTGSPDLFDLVPSQPERADVIVFPLARRSALVRKTADALSTLNEMKADRHWKSVLKALRTDLASAGVLEGEMNAHLVPFYRAVEAQLHERGSAPGEWPMGGSAA